MDINAAMTTATANMINAIGKTITVGGVSITADENHEYVEMQMAMGNVGSMDLAVNCISSDVSTATKGTAVVVDGVSYTVSHPPKPDGTGMTTLVLKKA